MDEEEQKRRIQATQQLSEKPSEGFMQKIRRNVDEFAQEKIANPLTEKGYPNLGAGLATIPSTAADYLLPEKDPTQDPLGSAMELAPVGKISKLGKVFEKAKINSDDIFKLNKAAKHAEQFIESAPAKYRQVMKAIDDSGGSYEKFVNILKGLKTKAYDAADQVEIDKVRKAGEAASAAMPTWRKP